MLTARTLTEGEKIREPGLYDLGIDAYHSQCADGPSVSGSGLRKLFAKSPAHFWLDWSGNQNRAANEDSDALLLGRAAHALLLGDTQFASTFVTRPEKWKDWRTNEAREWRDYQIGLGKVVLTPQQLEHVEGMRDGLWRNPLVRAGILNGAIEQSLFWKDKDTGIWLKSRPDAIPNDGGDVADLKTTTSVDRDAIERAIGEYGYFAQGALVGEAFKRVLDRRMESFSLVFVEKTPPYAARVVTLKDEDLALGAKQNAIALKMLARCLKTNTWPGPGDMASDAEFVEIKPWARTQAENRIAAIEMELEMAS